MNLVLIETSGNQRYIFATNKLRENVGASELTYQVGTKYVLEAIGKGDNDLDGNKLRTFLLDSKQNQAIEKNSSDDAVEVVIATSGKAILLVKKENTAKKIVNEVTKTALVNMPGLTVHGSICKVKDDLSDIHNAVGEVHRRLETIRYQMPSNEQRFLRLPFVTPCATSGLPATRIYRHESLKDINDELKPYAVVSIEKQEASNRGRNRLEATIQSVKPNVKLIGNINELEKKFKETQWIAIIHADGNGMGEIFKNFDQHTGLRDKKCTVRQYIEKYREFSLALDECTINAAGFAIENFQNNYGAAYQKRTGKEPAGIPFIPLILGGDDLTVICDGQYALKFTYDFLTDFESQTSQKPIIKEIARNAFGVERLGICAGIAIIKPHYPFHQAYELAEHLLKSAKQVKKQVVQDDGRQYPCSALDFHIVYDSTSTDLDMIRDERLTADGKKTKLCAKPYVVTENLDGHNTNPWLQPRKFEELKKRVEAMIAPAKEDSTRRALPNSKLHEIRQALFRGKEVADAEAKLIENRLSPEGKVQFSNVKCDDSIFFTIGDENFTHFLDAIEAVDFWKGFDNKESSEAKNQVTLSTESEGKP
jgi:hypothetical protein